MSEPVVAPPRRESRFALWFGRFMYFPGIGGNFVPLIQALKVFERQSAGDVSLVGWAFALFCISCWLAYGVVRRDKVLIAANVIGVINIIILIVAIVMHR